VDIVWRRTLEIRHCYHKCYQRKGIGRRITIALQ
jgi:hypothetical protein